jgi:hypothetical protein
MADYLLRNAIRSSCFGEELATAGLFQAVEEESCFVDSSADSEKA